MSLNKENGDLEIKYSPDGTELGTVANNRIKVNKVALKCQNQKECVQFLKIFYKVQKIQLARKLNLKKKVRKKEARVI